MRHGRLLLILTLAALGACSGSPIAPTPTSGEVTPSPAPAASSMSSSAASWYPRRPEADLRRAMLASGDLPAGLVVVPTQPSGATASSADPQCATLAMIINTPTAVGAIQHVEERLAGGDRGPFVDQQISELDSPAGVAAEQAQLKGALASCSTLTITDSGHPPDTAYFSSIPPPRGGQDSVAFRASELSGGGNVFEFTQVIAGVDDTVVLLSFVGAQPSQIDEISSAALDRAAQVLTAATPSPS